MSLTTELDDSGSPTRRFLEERFPNTRRVTGEANAILRKAETIQPSSPLPWGTLGTAFDYRARYYFRATPSKELVAWHGALAIGGADAGWEDTDQSEDLATDGPTISPEGSGVVALRRFQGRIQRYTGTNIMRAVSSEPRQRGVIVPPELATDFFASLDETLARTGPEGRLLEPGDEELLARYCVVLALFEDFVRPGAARAYAESPLLGVGSAPTVDGLLDIAEGHWVDDICRLSEAFFHAFDGRFSGNAVLNPRFQGSGDVGGADADIIVDGCLVDFKATVKASIEKVRGLYQLIGYLLLDYDDEYGIEKLGLYMARQGQVIEWPVADLFERLTGQGLPSLQELRREFRDRITRPR